MILLVAGVLAFAADTLRGTVTDTLGHPLPGATVSLPALRRDLATDSLGVFVATGVPPGRYTIVVWHPGARPVLRDVAVPTAGPISVVLRGGEVRLQAVAITAHRATASPLASALPTDELSGEQLRRSQGVELARALDGLPGVRTISSGEQVGKPMIRGLFGPRVLTLDNGSRLEDYSWSNEDGPSVDPRLARRVEVIRGPASLLYGSDAIGGVINVIPEDLPDGRVRAAFVNGAAEISGASNNSELGTVLRLEGGAGDIGWRVTGIGRRASNIRTPPGNDSTPSGVLFDTGYESINGEAELGLHTDRGYLSARFSRYGGDFGLLDGSPAPTDNVTGPLRRLSDTRVQLTGSQVLSPVVRLEATAQYERHWLEEVVGPSRTGGGAPPFSEPSFDLTLQTGSMDVVLHHTPVVWLAGAVGVSGSYQGNVSRGITPLVPGAHDGTAAVFGLETVTMGRWHLTGGLRGDVRRLVADSNATLATGRQTRNAAALTGNLGAVYSVADGVALAANVGRAFRSPTVFELFTNGPHLGEGRYEIGIPAAGPEVSWNEDFSTRWQCGRFAGEVAVYHNVIGGFLYIAPTGQTRNALTDAGVQPFPVYQYHQTRAVLDGADAAGELAVLPLLSVRGRFDFVQGTNRATGQPLPLMPPLRGDIGVDLHTPSAERWADRAYLNVATEMVDRPRRLAPFDTPTPGYTLLNLGGGLTENIGTRSIVLDVEVRNALDRVYADFLSRYKYFAYGQGRNLIVRLSTKF